MRLTVYTDGGSLNNPGAAAIAYVIYYNEKLHIQRSMKIGIATNNIAEYTALKEALTYIKNMYDSQIAEICVFSDSKLMVSQLNGAYKIKDKPIRKMVDEVKKLEQEIQKPIVYTHIPREQNMRADSLVKKALGS